MEIKLNLIPAYRKEEINQSRRFGYVLKWEIQMTFILVFLIFMLVALNYTVKTNLQVVVDENMNHSGNVGKYEEMKSYDSLVKNTNAKVFEIDKIQSDQLYWSKFFMRIDRGNLNGLTMDSMVSKDFLVTIAGKAETRDNLISFKEALEKEDCFSEINLPLSNLVSKENVEFKIELKIKPECVK